MKKTLKILGILMGAIVLIVLFGAATIQFSGIPSYETNPPSLTVEPDSALIAEGKRLATLVCNHCHQAPSGKLEGKFMSDIPAEFGKVWAPNITQFPQSRLAPYTDGELAFLLRTGIKRDGKYAPPWMPKFPHLSDEDLHSIIAYLRSDARELQPSEKVQPAPQPSFLVKLLCRIAFKPLPYPDKTIEAPPITDKVAYGRYLVTSKIDCYSCHSEDFKTMNIEEPEKSGGYLGGGNPMLSPEDGKTVVYSANLTMDKETGIGNWTEEEFIKAVRFGQRPDGKPLRQPMIPFSALSGEEVSAIWAYLKTAPPIRNEVARNWGE
ncbi:MAG: cytochrome c [Lewinellaceae bacterium]|nr:cytochrome c [Phaeodactylibacter sp.]MCB0612157.1 cytochrome c [Phaeodactylibacter sp.]MCB9347196.1 cytochrome c [Lewinellaceae bacterium]